MKKRSRALIIKVLAAPFLLFAKKGVTVSLYDAIYTRQSVDRIDSISVESQAEFCKKEVIGQELKVYTDKGYSGKILIVQHFRSLCAISKLVLSAALSSIG